jgi:serine protease Do
VHAWRILPVSLLLALSAPTGAGGLPDTISRIKPAIVAVGTYMPLRQQQQSIGGTGFAVAGNLAATNAHTVPEKVDADRRETLAVFVPDEGIREGQAIAFTGFPILNALGLHPATHQGIVSAITPVVIPVGSGRELNRTLVTRLDRPFDIYQLDAVAYPGNSGSPVYDPDSGRVLAVVNSTFVKETKERAIAAPSGISYAIPVRHLRALLTGAGVKE